MSTPTQTPEELRALAGEYDDHAFIAIDSTDGDQLIDKARQLRERAAKLEREECQSNDSNGDGHCGRQTCRVCHPWNFTPAKPREPAGSRHPADEWPIDPQPREQDDTSVGPMDEAEITVGSRVRVKYPRGINTQFAARAGRVVDAGEGCWIVALEVLGGRIGFTASELELLPDQPDATVPTLCVFCANGAHEGCEAVDGGVCACTCPTARKSREKTVRDIIDRSSISEPGDLDSPLGDQPDARECDYCSYIEGVRQTEGDEGCPVHGRRLMNEELLAENARLKAELAEAKEEIVDRMQSWAESDKAKYEDIAALTKERDESKALLRDRVKLCRCMGTGRYTQDCTLCGDSTFDHECNDVDVECKDEGCKAARAFLEPATGEQA